MPFQSLLESKGQRKGVLEAPQLLLVEFVLSLLSLVDALWHSVVVTLLFDDGFAVELYFRLQIIDVQIDHFLTDFADAGKLCDCLNPVEL